MTSTLALGLRALRPYLARTRRRRVSMCCRGGLGLCPRTSSCIGPRGSRAIAGQRLTLTAFCTENIPEEKKIFARRVGFFLFFVQCCITVKIRALPRRATVTVSSFLGPRHRDDYKHCEHCALARTNVLPVTVLG